LRKILQILILSLLIPTLIGSPFHASAGNGGRGDEDAGWAIDLELSPDTPAKNQEVSLSVSLSSPIYDSASGIPLDVRLTSLSSPPDIQSIRFLGDAAPLTDGNGSYESVFNAPYFHSHGDGHYRINVSAETPDGPVSASRELSIVENVLDVKGIQVAHDAAPATWYRMALYDFDREALNIGIFQNGAYHNGTWTESDWTVVEGMYEGGKGESSDNAVYEVMETGDELTSLRRFEGDSPTLLNEYGYPAKTTLCSFLVSEVSGENIGVSISGRIDGQSKNISFEIPSIPLVRPCVGATNRVGEWFLKSSGGTGGTWQGSVMHIYSIGFLGNVTVDISAMGQSTEQRRIFSSNYMAHYRWSVPSTQFTGQNYVTFEGTDSNGVRNTAQTDFYVAEEPRIRELHEPDNYLAVVGTVAAILLIVLLSFTTYTRIKRKKLLDHATRMRIYRRVRNEPGVHFRALMEGLELKTGTLSYHLNVLEREEYLRSYQDGMYRRFALFDEISPSTFRLSNIQGRILGAVRKHPGITQTRLSKLVGSSRMVVNYHIRILRDVDLVSIERDGRETHCYFRG